MLLKLTWKAFRMWQASAMPYRILYGAQFAIHEGLLTIIDSEGAFLTTCCGRSFISCTNVSKKFFFSSWRLNAAFYFLSHCLIRRELNSLQNIDLMTVSGDECTVRSADAARMLHICAPHVSMQTFVGHAFDMCWIENCWYLFFVVLCNSCGYL